MNVKAMFPSNYIAHEDLQSQDVPVQIAGCRMEPLKQDNGPDREKPVLYFVGHQRGLVLNQVNAMTISSLYGDETEAWRGRWITLYPTQCQFGARMVDCIRVRPFPPQQGNVQPTLYQQPQPQPFGQQPRFVYQLQSAELNGPAQPQPFPTQQPPPPAGQQPTAGEQHHDSGHSPIQF
jgi:hypothetical protein